MHRKGNFCPFFSHFWLKKLFLKKNPLDIFENWSTCSFLGIFQYEISEKIVSKILGWIFFRRGVVYSYPYQAMANANSSLPCSYIRKRSMVQLPGPNVSHFTSFLGAKSLLVAGFAHAELYRVVCVCGRQSLRWQTAQRSGEVVFASFQRKQPRRSIVVLHWHYVGSAFAQKLSERRKNNLEDSRLLTIVPKPTKHTPLI